MIFSQIQKFFSRDDQINLITERAHFKFLEAQISYIEKSPSSHGFYMDGINIASRLFTDGDEIDALLKETENAKSSARFIYLFDGEIWNGQFPYIKMLNLKIGNHKVSYRLSFRPGEVNFLDGCEELGGYFSQSGRSYTVVEAIAVSSIDVKSVGKNTLQEFYVELEVKIKGSINYLIRRLSLERAGALPETINIAYSNLYMMWIGGFDAQFVEFVFFGRHQPVLEIELEPTERDLQQAIENLMKQKELSAIYRSPENILDAIDFRLYGKFRLVPIFCHTAVEMLIDLFVEKAGEDKKLRFKEKLKIIKKIEPENHKLKRLLELYSNYGYEIRNKVAHLSTETSAFLADYCLYLSIDLVNTLCDLKVTKDYLELTDYLFPFKSNADLDKMTKELKSLYIDKHTGKFKSYTLWPD